MGILSIPIPVFTNEKLKEIEQELINKNNKLQDKVEQLQDQITKLRLGNDQQKKPAIYNVGDWVMVTDDIMHFDRHAQYSIGKEYKIDKNFYRGNLVFYSVYKESINESGIVQVINTSEFPEVALIKIPIPESETIEVHGKTFVKSDYFEAIKNLKEVKESK